MRRRPGGVGELINVLSSARLSLSPPLQIIDGDDELLLLRDPAKELFEAREGDPSELEGSICSLSPALISRRSSSSSRTGKSLVSVVTRGGSTLRALPGSRPVK